MSVRKALLSVVAVSAVAVVAVGGLSCGGKATQSGDVCDQPRKSWSEKQAAKCDQEIAIVKGETINDPNTIGIKTPCSQPKYFDTPELMTALGISRPQKTQSQAQQDAVAAAQTDLGQRFTGVLESFVEDFVNSGETLDDDLFGEGGREAAVKKVGRMVVKDYMRRGCQDFRKDLTTGKYIGYFVGQIPLKKAFQGVVSDEAFTKLTADKDKAFAKLDKYMAEDREQQQEKRKGE